MPDMTPLGLGIDLVEVARIRDLLTKHGDRFKERTFTAGEIAYCDSCADPAMHYAARFAAKEAFSKAIGLGMRMPMTWRSLQTLNEPSGKPVTSYLGALAKFMEEKNWVAHVTVSDEQDMAIAHVIVTQK